MIPLYESGQTRMLGSSGSENRQRVGVLALLPNVVRRLGADPVEVLAEVGLGADALDNPEDTIAYRTMGLLVEEAARKTNCPHFGLEVGRQIRTGMLGLLGEQMRNAPNIRVALQDFASNQHRNAHGSVMYLIEDQQQACFGYAVYEPNVPGNAVICDGALMAALNVIHELAGPNHVPVREILFSRSKPQDLLPYQRYFGVKLLFNAEQNAVVLPRGLLEQRIAGADLALHKLLKQRVHALWRAGDLDILTQLRRELRIALVKGPISAAKIVTQLSMSRRTLSRRLDEAGTSFQEVLDEMRCEFVQQLLVNTQLSVGEVARAVGYTDPAALTRGFTRWTGVNPREWKRSYEARTEPSRATAFSSAH